MNDAPEKKPRDESAAARNEDRRQRQAEALRRNLLRRKDQTRTRDADRPPSEGSGKSD